MEVNREHDLGQSLRYIRIYCDVLINEVNRDDQILIKKFLSHYETMCLIAPSYDVLDVPANGLRSVLRTYFNVIKKCSKEHRTHQDVLNCVELIRNSAYGIEYAIQNLNIDHTKNVVSDCSQEYLEQIEFVANTQKLCQLFAKEFVHVDYEHLTKLVWLRKFFIRLIGVCTSRTALEQFKSFISYEFALENYNLFATNAGSVFKVLNWQENAIFKFLYRMYSTFGHFRTNVTTINLSISRNWEIVRDSLGIKIKNISQEPKVVTIRGCLLKTPDVNSSRNGKVLLYIHGQAFVGPTDVEFAVNGYLRKFSSELLGLSIIAVEYPSGLGVTFPRGLQAILDFYLWLISGHDDVIKQLGFAPNEIVISGDSAGGNLAMALVVAINEIRLKAMATDDVIRFPNSLVFLYPAVNFSSSIRPSKLIGNFDVFLRPEVVLSIRDNYCLGDPDYSKSSKKIFSHEDFETFLRNPLLSPVLYQRMDDLKEISLTMIIINTCPLLDDGLELCSKWKGPKKLFALDGVCHPFLELTNLNSDSRDATRFAIREIDAVLSSI